MREKFLEIAFRTKTRALIDQALIVIDEYRERGFTLTVRQLYYQFVARDWLKNTFNNYQRLASVVDDARKAGLIPWDAIEDRTRFLRGINTYSTPRDYMQSLVDGYHEDIWRDQDYHVEVWIEKDALLGVIEGVCNEQRVDYFACRGYPSSSELYKAGKRLGYYRSIGKWPIVFYLGDHDPSGLQMVLNSDCALQQYGRSNDIEVRQLALTMAQIEEHNPPPNYAKETDSRFNWYCDTTGTEECWELDALDPGVIAEVIRENVESVMDRDKFDSNISLETAHRNTLKAIADDFGDGASIVRFLRNHTPAMDSELIRRQLARKDV